MRYSQSTTDYPIADALLEELRQGDPNGRLSNICNSYFRNPDSMVRRNALKQLFIGNPSIYSRILTDNNISTLTDSSTQLSTIDAIIYSSPEYLTQLVLDKWNHDPQLLYPWLVKSTSDSTYLSDSYCMESRYGNDLAKTVSNYGDAAAANKSVELAVGKTDFDLYTTPPSVYKDVMLCNDADDMADSIVICYDELVAHANLNAAIRDHAYEDSLYSAIKGMYTEYIKSSLTGNLFLYQGQKKYALTLYQYDRIGNLTATTPPMGVNHVDSTLYNFYGTDDQNGYDSVLVFAKNYPDGNTSSYPYLSNPNHFLPHHSKQTVYSYNSLNNKISETTPDGGLTHFIYDAAGRVLFSQNSKQAPNNQFTYSLYDAQNRIIETGQVMPPANPIGNITSTDPLTAYISNLYSMNFSQVVPTASMAGIINNYVRDQVVHTTYDTVLKNFATSGALNNGLDAQQNLRSRVSCVSSYSSLAIGKSADTNFEIALHYSYDLSGNLKTLTYDMPRLSPYRQQFKRIDYDYDLYSGKVTLVSYDRGFADQFYQRYAYDDDNRITLTETSHDGVLWDRDAEYKYFPHGPLARISLGDQRVQGIDFAYTLQGWLKSINGDAPGVVNDMGGDGTSNSTHQSDMMRTSLYYYAGDYKPIDSTDASNTASTHLLKLPPPALNHSLYNGNIASSAMLPAYFDPLRTDYRYDKLNRIKEANYNIPDYTSATPLTPGGVAAATGPGSLYFNNYTYDQDGNLTSLNRYGYNHSASGTTAQKTYLMDSLYYFYTGNNPGGTRTGNRLTNYTDTANHSTGPGAGFTNDLAKYGPPNAASVLRLQYDPTGNLVKDLSNGLTNIDWTLYGKTSKIESDNGQRINFTYDPLGNRFSKTVYTASPGKDSVQRTEYYIREASGNILAIYRQEQHYYYYNPSLPSSVTSLGVPLSTLASVISSTYGSNSSFMNGIVGGTLQQLPTIANSRIAARSASFYIQNLPSARAALISSTPNASWQLRNYYSGLGAQLYPASEGYNAEPFSPLARGIQDTTALEAAATAMFSSADSSLMRTQYAAMRSSPLADTTYSKSDLGRLLASDILYWRAAAPGGARSSAELKRLFWPTIDSNNQPASNRQTVYTAAINAVLSDSNYLKQAVIPGMSEDDDGYLTLNDRLDQRLTTAALQKSLNTEEQPLAAQVYGFLNQQYGGSGTDTYNKLRLSLGDQALLSADYAAGPESFLTSIMSESGGMGGGSDSALNVLYKAMQVGATGSPNAAASPAGILSTLAATSSSAQSQISNSLVPALDYDRFYLSEHHLYGSSRLGIKKYWPTQYRYEWDKNKTIAQNQANFDSSDIAYRMPWFNDNWQSLVSANEVNPVGHLNLQPFYSSRILGQKQYELTNHLGNVMAVVSDKVTEVKANPSSSLPGLAQKRAGLNAAYDYYPFGMIMPDRSVEDNSVQCIPVTRSRLVNQVNTGDVLLPVLDDHLEPPVIIVIDPGKLIAGDQVFNAIQASVVQLEEGGSGSPGEVISAQNGDETEVAGYISLPAISSGQTGLSVSVTNPTMNADGMMFFTLSKLNDPGNPDAGEQDLTQVQVMTAGESAVLEVNDGLNPGDVMRLWAHGIANNPPERGYLTVAVPSVVTSVITQTVQSYVAMSCDTDGAFQDGYRFGFNDKEKDNEVAGSGNFQDYGMRAYNSRLARFISVDPIKSKYPELTTYQFASNSPISGIDLDGLEYKSAGKWAIGNLFGMPSVNPKTGEEKQWYYTFRKYQDPQTLEKIKRMDAGIVCYESCLIAYARANGKVASWLDKTNIPLNRADAMKWFKGKNDGVREFLSASKVEDIKRADLGDIMFKGKLGQNNGHSAMVASPPIFAADGLSFTIKTYSAFADSRHQTDPQTGQPMQQQTDQNGMAVPVYGIKEYTFVKQGDAWIDAGSGQVLSGFGRINEKVLAKKIN